MIDTEHISDVDEGKVMQESQFEEQDELIIEDEQGSELNPDLLDAASLDENTAIESSASNALPSSATDSPVESINQDKLISVLNQVVETIQKQAVGAPLPKVEDQYATALHWIKDKNNHYQGARWFRKAAMRGHAKSQFYLGVLFAKGQGVPQSLFHAYAWLTLADCQQLPEAQESLKKIEPLLSNKLLQQALKLAAERFEQIESQLSAE